MAKENGLFFPYEAGGAYWEAALWDMKLHSMSE